MTAIRSLTELVNLSSTSNHSNGKGIFSIDHWISISLFLHLEHYSCEYGSIKYYIYCGLSGMLGCGVTHTAVVPLVSDIYDLSLANRIF